MTDIYKNVKTPDVLKGYKTVKSEDITIEKERARIRREFSKRRKKEQRDDSR